MLQANNLSIYLRKDDRLLIDRLNFSLQAGDKVALIGEEGNGKSTLLRLLRGDKTLDDTVRYTGTIVRTGTIGYLPQFLPEREKDLALSDYLKDVDVYDNYKLADSFGFDYGWLTSEQKLKELSGGEAVKLQLFKILCAAPSALLLDEPTNDLDIDTLTFLQEFIASTPTPVLFVSHDETLIEECANAIIHIEQLIRKTKCRITVSRLPYLEYLRARNLEFDRQAQIANKERAEYKKKKERLQQLYEKAKRNSSWKNPDGIPSSDGGAKKHLQTVVSLSKRFEREKQNFEEIPDREERIRIEFFPDVNIPPRKRVLDLSLPELKIGERTLAKNVNLSVTGNEHICIIGKNGAGKSTLLKEIYKRLQGREDMIAGYMPQNYREVLDFTQTPTEFLRANADKNALQQAKSMLAYLRFTGKESEQPIGELSGGQRAKLILLNLILRRANVLILDEPTRNFSPLSAPAVRSALASFGGAIIGVSHDRKYLDEVADTVYLFDENGLTLL